MKTAITRRVSASLNDCQLTHLEREPIDLELARQQHQAYEMRLASLGCEIQSLPEQPDMPDAVFVEDNALVLDELAVMARPGAASRRRETPSVKQVLSRYRPVSEIHHPGTLEGGDVMKVGKVIFVGLSSRTNSEGIAQLASLVNPAGYAVIPVPVHGCLHLKSAVTQVSENILLINRNWVATAAFESFELLDIHPSELLAANALLLEEAVIYPEHYPRTRQRLEEAGLQVFPVNVSELAKAEGGVTCCSLIFTT